MSGRGLSYSLESSSEGRPHRAINNSASLVTPGGTGLPLESVIGEVGTLEGGDSTSCAMIAPINASPMKIPKSQAKNFTGPLVNLCPHLGHTKALFAT